MKRNKMIFHIIWSLIFFLFYFLPTFFYPFDESWYNALNKPMFMLTYEVYQFVSSCIYAMMSIGIAMVLLTPHKEAKRLFITLIFLNYFFIHAYPFILFNSKDTLLAFVDTLLILATNFMIYITGKQINKKASILFVPLVAWAFTYAFINVVYLNIINRY